jgi:hypothetical protein
LMKFKFFLVLLPALVLTSGCSSFFGSEPPAKKAPTKVIPKKPATQNPQSAVPAPKKPTPGSGTATYPIDSGSGSFKNEESLPVFRGESLLPAPVNGVPGLPAAQPPAAPVVPAPGAALIPEPQTSLFAPVPTQAAPAVPGSVVPAVSTPVNTEADAGGTMPVNIMLEDASFPSGTSPAVVALVGEADRSRRTGDLNTAVLIMERALRIDPRNPTITYKLAQIRFKQNKMQQAEELAGKASLLAGGNLELKRKSLMLIAEARRIQRNTPPVTKDSKDKLGAALSR